MREGQIIKSISGEYTIALGKDKIVCKPRGVFRYKGMSPKVGDIVLVNEETRSIIEIKKRKNDLIRPVIANVDKAFLVFSVKVSQNAFFTKKRGNIAPVWTNLFTRVYYI